MPATWRVSNAARHGDGALRCASARPRSAPVLRPDGLAIGPACRTLCSASHSSLAGDPVGQAGTVCVVASLGEMECGAHGPAARRPTCRRYEVMATMMSDERMAVRLGGRCVAEHHWALASVSSTALCYLFSARASPLAASPFGLGARGYGIRVYCMCISAYDGAASLRWSATFLLCLHA